MLGKTLGIFFLSNDVGDVLAGTLRGHKSRARQPQLFELHGPTEHCSAYITGMLVLENAQETVLEAQEIVLVIGDVSAFNCVLSQCTRPFFVSQFLYLCISFHFFLVSGFFFFFLWHNYDFVYVIIKLHSLHFFVQ